MQRENEARPARRAVNLAAARHFGGFLVAGGTAFLIDAGLTLALVHGGLLGPFLARLVAIFCAMVAAWLMHRRITFNVTTPASFREFVRFCTVAWSASALNYLVYSAVLLIWPATPLIFALVASTAAAMVFSYLGFRFGVFRHTQ